MENYETQRNFEQRNRWSKYSSVTQGNISEVLEKFTACEIITAREWTLIYTTVMKNCLDSVIGIFDENFNQGNYLDYEIIS